MSSAHPRPRSLDRELEHRLRRLYRAVGDDLERLRVEAGVTQAQLGRAAGVDRSFYGRIARGEARPSIETLIALGVVLGADLSVRLWSGTGPRLVDRHSARMTQVLLTTLHPVWRPHLEVPVRRPARGVVDLVLERLDGGLLVCSEVQSVLPRLEQTIRWGEEKAASIGSSRLVRDGTEPPVSRLLLVRSTRTTREVAQRFQAVLAAAYPSRSADAVASLTTGTPWPGPAIVWIRLEERVASLLPGPPRGVSLGR